DFRPTSTSASTAEPVRRPAPPVCSLGRSWKWRGRIHRPRIGGTGWCARCYSTGCCPTGAGWSRPEWRFAPCRRCASRRCWAAQTLDVVQRAGVEAVVVNAAGCGSNMKEYDLQLRSDPTLRPVGEAFSRTVRDASEFLASLAPLRAPRRGLRLRVAYQDPCHLLHGQRISQQPRQLLAAIPGVQLVELKEADWCCGSAGVYNLP